MINRIDAKNFAIGFFYSLFLVGVGLCVGYLLFHYPVLFFPLLVIIVCSFGGAMNMYHERINRKLYN